MRGEREQYLAGRLTRFATGRLAVDAVGGEAAYAAFDEAGPHAVVDSVRAGTVGDDGSERAGGRRKLRALALERDDRSLKAERAERVADTFQSGSNASRRLQTGCGGKVSPEVFARLAKCLLPASSGDLFDQERDQLRQAPVWELDAFELGRDAVDLRGPPGSRAAGAATFERDCEESCLGEAIQAAAGDVAVRAECVRGLGGGERIAPASRVHEGLPKLRVAGRCKSVERHGRKRYLAHAALHRPKQRRIG